MWHVDFLCFSAHPLGMQMCMWLLRKSKCARSKSVFSVCCSLEPVNPKVLYLTFPDDLIKEKTCQYIFFGPNKSQKLKNFQQFVSLRWELVPLNYQHMRNLFSIHCIYYSDAELEQVRNPRRRTIEFQVIILYLHFHFTWAVFYQTQLLTFEIWLTWAGSLSI